MNVLLISECDHKALTQTRRILDQFAERRGERTWQTPITRDGLDTLRRLLRQSARKNTAVACHWIRGLDHSELLWVVGDRSRFNPLGAVPTNTTERNILHANDENDWHTGEDIHLLAGLAALLHDLGKASRAFQMRLRGTLTERNQYRHEWVSLRLFEAFVGTDDDATWLARLANPTPADDASWQARLQRDGMDANVQPPFVRLAHAPLAEAIGWLVLTHHRLPTVPTGKPITTASLHQVLRQIDAGWNERTDGGDPDHRLPLYWDFAAHGLPVTTDAWRKQASKLAQRLLGLHAQPGKGQWLGNPYVMHIARLSLMLADHHYSSLGVDQRTGQPVASRVSGQTDYPLFANTHASVPEHHNGHSNPHHLNQTLDEHLVGVARHSAIVTHALPRFDTHLPHLGECKPLKKRAKDERFRWQDKAADLAASVRGRSAQHGAFIVNMASTGCGKTLANARVMYALADPAQGMRCAFAMGLRTLTLQTGRAFRDLLGLADDELAIRVGGSASRALFEHHERMAEQTGSASTQALVEEDGHVVFEGNHEAHPVLQRVLHDPHTAKLLVAPLLVCTIDHLTPATESQRGGRQIAPMLRLMSGDLVLDEPDDFDIADLPALTRLVHWAGLLGARVLLSSATLPPALVQGLFEAYRQGRVQFARNRGERPGDATPSPEVCCLWVDEYRQQHADCTDLPAYTQAHQTFARERVQRLAEAVVCRRAKFALLELGQRKCSDHPAYFAREALQWAQKLHAAHHSLDPHSGKRISFGLVRMANIEPLVDVALALYSVGVPEGQRIHLCVYHSQFPLLIRSDIEQQLDHALNRRSPDAVFSLPDIRQRIDAYPDEADHLFIVLGSPVTEVGRDHDYDWAVVEPSSMRSLIQLAGRVRRHRPDECTQPNLRVFVTNLRHFQHPGEPAFCHPGFESASHPLHSHNLIDLLRPEEYAAVDSRPRIQARDALQAATHWVDLEHARMQATMLPLPPTAPNGVAQRGRASAPPLNAASWWHLPAADALLTAALPQQQPFRQDTIPRVDLVLMPNDEGDDYALQMLLAKTGGHPGEYHILYLDRSLNKRIPDEQVQGPRIAPWGQTDYMAALTELAADMDMTLADCARRFGTVTLPQNAQGWRFHPVLGFTKQRG
ncbi:type I-F CRISPR-associated helicase Cas3f [Candidatus Symbiobacter mobilis]|uniref:Helicase-like protein n=1 Tax=Candidatus Symbiobacter mobilis CR TaxID=946483 RepID=U5NDN0_9BURK|nr:type I-F CRISPR-associated helicase Cas3f [Candidatus Symbiobacter mobilis]AGX88274.1 helicase-like protein [Candidatus Symbiobacter mobilis CR]